MSRNIETYQLFPPSHRLPHGIWIAFHCITFQSLLQWTSRNPIYCRESFSLRVLIFCISPQIEPFKHQNTLRLWHWSSRDTPPSTIQNKFQTFLRSLITFCHSNGGVSSRRRMKNFLQGRTVVWITKDQQESEDKKNSNTSLCHKARKRERVNHYHTFSLLFPPTMKEGIKQKSVVFQSLITR